MHIYQYVYIYKHILKDVIHIKGDARRVSEFSLSCLT